MSEMVSTDPGCSPAASPAAGVFNLAEPVEWFAASTLPRHEKVVAHSLTEHRIENFLPLYSQEQRWKKRRPVVLQLPLFPSYIFVHIARSKRADVLRVPGVYSIVGTPRGPWPVKESEIEVLREAVRAGSAKPHAYLTVGERVRIVNGVLRGFEGILVRVKNEVRVVVSLEVILRSVAVEVATTDIEGISSHFPPADLN